MDTSTAPTRAKRPFVLGSVSGRSATLNVNVTPDALKQLRQLSTKHAIGMNELVELMTEHFNPEILSQRKKCFRARSESGS